jgi:hypothetical protein
MDVNEDTIETKPTINNGYAQVNPHTHSHVLN